MTDENQQIDTFAVVWGKLTPSQKRFAVAMQEYPTKKEAAESVGLSPNTVYNWPPDVDTAVAFMTNNIALATLGIIQANATKAAQVKVEGLDSKDEKVKQAAATEILDRQLGKAVQRSELTGADGGDVRVKFIDYGLNKDDTDAD